MPAQTVPSGYVRAPIVYLDRSVSKPYQYLCEPRDGEPINNFVQTTQLSDVLDIKSLTREERHKRGFRIEEAGFELLEGWGDQKSGIDKEWKEAERWSDDDWIKTTYYDDVDKLIKKRTGAHKTFIFDHTVRKSQTSHLPDDPQNRKPVGQAHVDQTRWAGENRLLKHLGASVLSDVKSGKLRAKLINVWRPLRGPVYDHPIAVADFRSAEFGEAFGGPKGAVGDFVASELRYEDWTGQTMLIYPNEKHRWHYARAMQPDEVLLLQCYDSATEVRTPHTAFEDPTTPKDAPPRWSVELRVLALIENDKADEAAQKAASGASL